MCNGRRIKGKGKSNKEEKARVRESIAKRSYTTTNLYLLCHGFFLLFCFFFFFFLYFVVRWENLEQSHYVCLEGKLFVGSLVVDLMK